MQVLITHGSKCGSTAGLAQMIGDALEARGFDVDVQPAKGLGPVGDYDAVIAAGALYAGRWHRDARRFVHRNAAWLRSRAVWLVSSGPLDGTASNGDLPAVRQVAKLAASIQARGQMTFGGRLAADATGFAARAMAKNHAGDWRDPDQVSAFAAAVASDLGKIEALRL